MNASAEILAGLLENIAQMLPERMDAERAAELAAKLRAIADELRRTA